MLNNIVTTDALLGLVLAGQAANIGLFWRLWNKIHNDFVPKTECVLRTAAQEDTMRASRDENRVACLAASGRDQATQERIDDLVKVIATRTAEAIMCDREILDGIGALLARK